MPDPEKGYEPTPADFRKADSLLYDHQRKMTDDREDTIFDARSRMKAELENQTIQEVVAAEPGAEEVPEIPESEPITSENIDAKLKEAKTIDEVKDIIRGYGNSVEGRYEPLSSEEICERIDNAIEPTKSRDERKAYLGLIPTTFGIYDAVIRLMGGSEKGPSEKSKDKKLETEEEKIDVEDLKKLGIYEGAVVPFVYILAKNEWQEGDWSIGSIRPGGRVVEVLGTYKGTNYRIFYSFEDAAEYIRFNPEVWDLKTLEAELLHTLNMDEIKQELNKFREPPEGKKALLNYDYLCGLLDKVQDDPSKIDIIPEKCGLRDAVKRALGLVETGTKSKVTDNKAGHTGEEMPPIATESVPPSPFGFETNPTDPIVAPMESTDVVASDESTGPKGPEAEPVKIDEEYLKNLGIYLGANGLSVQIDSGQWDDGWFVSRMDPNTGKLEMLKDVNGKVITKSFSFEDAPTNIRKTQVEAEPAESIPVAPVESTDEPTAETSSGSQKSEQEKQVESDYEAKLAGAMTIGEIKDAVKEFGHAQKESDKMFNYGYGGYISAICRIIDMLAVQGTRNEELIRNIPDEHGLRDSALRVLGIPRTPPTPTYE